MVRRYSEVSKASYKACFVTVDMDLLKARSLDSCQEFLRGPKSLFTSSRH